MPMSSKVHRLHLLLIFWIVLFVFIGIHQRQRAAKYFYRLTESYSEISDPDESFVYPEVVDFRVIVIAYDRAESLGKLLQSLDTVVLDGDTARLEIWLDRSKNGKVDSSTLEVAKSFRWSRGPTRVHIQKKHVGIYGQWIDTWSPRDNSTSEVAVILEDDINVSPFIYRWLKAVHQHYGNRTDYFGASLTSDQQSSHDGSGRQLTAPKNDTVFMYKCIGTWGLSPSPRQWLGFRNWFHTVARPDPNFHPYVPGIATTLWYKDFEATGRQDSMWEQWLIYFTHKERLFSVYTNLPTYNDNRKSCLCINRREVGLHNEHKGREDLCQVLTEWKDQYIIFPNETSTLDWNGLPKSGY